MQDVLHSHSLPLYLFLSLTPAPLSLSISLSISLSFSLPLFIYLPLFRDLDYVLNIWLSTIQQIHASFHQHHVLHFFVVHLMIRLYSQKIMKSNSVLAWRRGAVDISSAEELQTRVRIPPGYVVFRENIAMLLCISDLICSVVLFACWNREIKALAPIFLKMKSVSVSAFRNL
jgi:hypothetical protein